MIGIVKEPMYKISYLIGGSGAVAHKFFKTFQAASEFSMKIKTGDVLEIKRVEE